MARNTGIARLNSAHPSWTDTLKDLMALGITEDQIEEQVDSIKSYIEQRETQTSSTDGALEELSKIASNNRHGPGPVSTTRARRISSQGIDGTISPEKGPTPASHLAKNMQEQLDEVARTRNSPATPQSKYSHVDVLLLRWATDDLGVFEELEKLNNVFRSMFKFTTRTWDIPTQDSEDELMREIMNFRKGKRPGDLMILYYGGHAGGNPQECIWAANVQDDHPTLNWHNVQSYLLGSPADVLLILDCCFATLAARNGGIGDNWFLGASSKESTADGVSRNSFTSSLTRELERNAHIYWTKHKRFTVQDIHHALIIWERDLRFTPFLTRLTDHDCESTELTPLLQVSSKLQTVKSDPQPQMSYDAAGPSLAGRPLVAHATFPYNSDPVVPQERDFKGDIPTELSIGDSHTVRISGLPLTVDKHGVIQWLEARLKTRPLISRMGPLVPSSTKEMAVTFSSVATARQALSMQDKSFPIKAGEPAASIALDNEFLGLTCLYSSKVSSPALPYVDLVFVHGAHGHAINSFACHYARPAREDSWSYDTLPKALEIAGIQSRVMTYGWNANSWLNPRANILNEGENLVKELNRARRGESKRPVVFVGQGVGGLLIKQAVSEIVNSGFSEDDFENPVKACIFFAVPHHQTDSGGDFASILATMQVALGKGGAPKWTLARALKPRNRQITNLSGEFDDVRKEFSIRTISFYEERMTSNEFVVPKESAILDKAPGKAYGIDASYRDLARLYEVQHNRKVVLDAVCTLLRAHMGLPLCAERAKDANGPTGTPSSNDRPSSAPDKERVYARLQQYDTLFLVDDSDSMYGPRWRTTAHILAKIASIATKYDQNGVDIRFFNKYIDDAERRNLTSADQVMRLFSKVVPEGPTLTADILDEELNEYMYDYRKDRRKKGLNVIILTDGEPERRQNVEAVIVKYARKLKDMSAKQLQVGLQFVQIGGDEGAATFLKSLDDDLEKKYDLDRDVGFIFSGA